MIRSNGPQIFWGAAFFLLTISSAIFFSDVSISHAAAADTCDASTGVVSTQCIGTMDCEYGTTCGGKQGIKGKTCYIRTKMLTRGTCCASYRCGNATTADGAKVVPPEQLAKELTAATAKTTVPDANTAPLPKSNISNSIFGAFSEAPIDNTDTTSGGEEKASVATGGNAASQNTPSWTRYWVNPETGKFEPQLQGSNEKNSPKSGNWESAAKTGTAEPRQSTVKTNFQAQEGNYKQPGNTFSSGGNPAQSAKPVPSQSTQSESGWGSVAKGTARVFGGAVTAVTAASYIVEDVIDWWNMSSEQYLRKWGVETVRKR